MGLGEIRLGEMLPNRLFNNSQRAHWKVTFCLEFNIPIFHTWTITKSGLGAGRSWKMLEIIPEF